MFHLSYKKTALAPDELLYSITLPRKFAGYRAYIRKVGTRNAQAISKVALAGLALVENSLITDIRIAAASLREVPTRCPAAEAALLNQLITPETGPPPSPPPAPRSSRKPAPLTTSAPPPAIAPPSPPICWKNSSAA